MAGMASFEATELASDGSLQRATYAFLQRADGGWDVERNGDLQLRLAAGYELLRGVVCGLCGTDVARRFMPFPLPQIIGHEAVGRRADNSLAVVEINDGHTAHDDPAAAACAFCAGGIATQCPARTTFGIDRLPGGLAPFLLVPTHNVVPVPPSIGPLAAVLAEPLAAALEALCPRPPAPGERVAVLGVRRLGALIIAALVAHRRKLAPEDRFGIDAIVRHEAQAGMAEALGADAVLEAHKLRNARGCYDIVFEATGSPDGFEQALRLSRNVVHLKSTHGRPVGRISQLTAFVVDELALAAYSPERLRFRWASGAATPPADRGISVWCSPRAAPRDLPTDDDAHIRITRAPIDQVAWPVPHCAFGTFDVAIIGSLDELDSVVRPPHWADAQRARGMAAQGLVRARGVVLLAPGADGPADAVADALLRDGLQVHSSRCGSLRRAVEMLDQEPVLADLLVERLVTHRLPLDRLDEALALAADSTAAIKVVVETGA